jgi:hypothetical protein
MDVETTEAIERVGDRVDALGTSLRDEMVILREELRTELREGLAENRRHAQILLESVRDDIRMVFEAVTSLTAKPDAHGSQSG